jgi:hypothetical protein
MYRSILALALVACSTSPSNRDPLEVDAPGTLGVRPVWTLEDVQPASPRAGQTYGLDTFGGQIVVVTLLQGF